MTSKQHCKTWVLSAAFFALPCVVSSNRVLNQAINYNETAQKHITARRLTTHFSNDSVPDFTCLANKDFGKNMTASEIAIVSARYNAPSPFSFSSMIGLNDGGLVFRSFQGASNNQITQLTTQFRNFHTMDEDFDNTLTNYDQNIKPKDTYPEGTPAHIWYNKSLYNLYRNTHGFTGIVAATEILQYSPLSWKDKIYKEGDWSVFGPAGIKTSYENYTRKFIDEMAPPNSSGAQRLVAYYQVGNELWDYPVRADYHALLMGARSAFIGKYGQKSAGGWKMKLIAGAFQAYRNNTCAAELRNVSNCGGSLERHDFVGDYLNVSDCDLLRDLDAIDCHPYSFKAGTLTWTYPEDATSEGKQIINLAAWRDANRDTASGILKQTHLWSSEYGFDSNPTTGVGERTQAAYLVRGLMMHSRYHFEKVFFYNAFDVAKENSAYYQGLYNSSGFWKAGAHPLNNAWPSPLVAHGAKPKPAWHSMMDFKNRFGNHVFYKALVEDNDIYAYLLALPDGSDPYIVFWSPKQTNDVNINTNIAVSKDINWMEVLQGNYKLATENGRVFASDTSAGPIYLAATGTECGSTLLTTIRRNPTFIQLVSCDVTPPICQNISNAGTIVAPTPSSGNAPFTPGTIANSTVADGGAGGNIVYQWQQSPNGITFTDIALATSVSYAPNTLTQTTYYRRAAKRPDCVDFLFSNTIKLEVSTANGACANLVALKRVAHVNSGCNANGDYYFEIEVNNIFSNDKILIEGLPSNGLNIPMSNINGQFMSTAAFNTNVQYVSANSFRWVINASNGNSQKLRIFYCWANYPNPVANTTAKALCSGVLLTCAPGINTPATERNESDEMEETDGFDFKISPNPGKDAFLLTYTGAPAGALSLQVIASTGQVMSNQQIDAVEDQQQWYLDTQDWSPGLYFVRLQTETKMTHHIWVKY